MRVILISGDIRHHETIVKEILVKSSEKGDIVQLCNYLGPEMACLTKHCVLEYDTLPFIVNDMQVSALSSMYNAPIAVNSYGFSFNEMSRIEPTVLEKLVALTQVTDSVSYAKSYIFNSILTAKDLKYVDTLVIYNVVRPLDALYNLSQVYRTYRGGVIPTLNWLHVKSDHAFGLLKDESTIISNLKTTTIHFEPDFKPETSNISKVFSGTYFIKPEKVEESKVSYDGKIFSGSDAEEVPEAPDILEPGIGLMEQMNSAAQRYTRTTHPTATRL